MCSIIYTTYTWTQVYYSHKTDIRVENLKCTAIQSFCL
uniref:Uncharacterized protein n=1 Tax=Anguilla anguilla TaxID=7936 RepID=A0A0E9R5N5_ANGAN